MGTLRSELFFPGGWWLRSGQGLLGPQGPLGVLSAPSVRRPRGEGGACPRPRPCPATFPPPGPALRCPGPAGRSVPDPGPAAGLASLGEPSASGSPAGGGRQRDPLARGHLQAQVSEWGRRGPGARGERRREAG